MPDWVNEYVSAIYTTAVPLAFIIELCNIAVSTVLRAAFGGKMWFGR